MNSRSEFSIHIGRATYSLNGKFSYAHAERILIIYFDTNYQDVIRFIFNQERNPTTGWYMPWRGTFLRSVYPSVPGG